MGAVCWWRVRRAYDGASVSRGSIALRDGEVVLGASDGAIALQRVRPESGKSMSAVAWWSGARLDDGRRAVDVKKPPTNRLPK